MNTSVNKFAEALRTCPNDERAHVVLQIEQRGREVWGAIVARFLEIDESERRSIIMPVIVKLYDPMPAAREEAALELLSIGHFCLPFLEEMLVKRIQEHESLPEKVVAELKQLNRSILDVDYSLVNNNNGYSSLAVPSPDLLLQACIPAIPAQPESVSVQASDMYTKVVCEINVDAWIAARKEILQFGGSATCLLTEALLDPDTQIRRVAIQLLGILQDTKSEPFLINALGDPDVFVRSEAIRALGRLKGSVYI